LIVAFHVVGNSEQHGLRLPEEHPLRQTILFLAHLPMPLFAAVSGNLYGLRPVRHGEAGRFLGHRLRQLGLPFLVNSTIFFLLQSALHGQLDASHLAGIWRIYVYPYAVFWFLSAMLLVFAMVCALDLLGMLRHPASLCAVVLLAFAERLLPPDRLVYLSLDAAFYLLPFFLIGLATRRFAGIMGTRPVLLACAVALPVALAVYRWTMHGLPAAQAVSRLALVGPIIGGTGAVLLLRVAPIWQPLVHIGRHALSIYLFQIYFIVATRLTLQAIGVDDSWVHFGLGTLAGLLGPILLEPWLQRWPLLRLGLLGTRR
jgi:fucose 4-O-acetylase-like acetyltransferase